MEIKVSDYHSIQQILSKYGYEDSIGSIQTYGSGHINDTYLIEVLDNQYIFQRVNKNIFNAEALTSNYEVLYEALEGYQKKHQLVLSPRCFQSQQHNYHEQDKHGSPCRLLDFVNKSTTYDISPSAEVSHKAAQAFGRFQVFLNTMTTTEFQETIANFHDPMARFKEFQRALLHGDSERKAKAEDTIRLASSHASIISEISNVMQQGVLPKRITHNDTKLNNVVFTDTDAWVIDLDTVMPGSIIFDFGDMVRTFTSPEAEDSSDLAAIQLRLDHFEALCRGYLKPLKNELHPMEVKHLLLGTKSVIYVQALRFLSDYLMGDTYYKTQYPSHNLTRSASQFKLLNDLILNKNEIRNILNSYV